MLTAILWPEDSYLAVDVIQIGREQIVRDHSWHPDKRTMSKLPDGIHADEQVLLSSPCGLTLSWICDPTEPDRVALLLRQRTVSTPDLCGAVS